MSNKPIRLSKYALSYTDRRGFTQSEVIEAIENAEWEPSELERLQCRKDFIFEREWNGKFYKLKQVRPIFVEEEIEIVVITVYTYYY